MSGLFRDEVAQAQRPRSLGTIRLATPISHQVWGLVAAVFTAAILLWLFLGHYTQREHVSGTLVPQAGLLNVTARTTGTVTKLDVAQGTQVRAGQVLLSVSGDRSSAAMGDTDATVAAQIEAQETQIRATLAGLAPKSSAQVKGLRTQISMLHAQLIQIDNQQALQRKQAANTTNLWHKAQPLHQEGIVSTVEFDQYKDQALAQHEQVKALARQRLDITQQLSSLQSQLTQLPINTATKAHQLRGQLAQLKATLAQNDVQQTSVLRAAQAGTVSAVLIQPGQTVKPGLTLMTIMPKGSSLQAQLLVPSSAIGFVHQGTPVVLHYQAFPYQKFGVQHGTVTEVSRSALTPVELTQLLGRAPPPVPLYRVEVKLASQSIEAYGKPHLLMPGMALNADLLLDHRRIIDWILEPLYGMAKRGGGKA